MATKVPKVLAHIYYNGNMASREEGVVGSARMSVRKKERRSLGGIWKYKSAHLSYGSSKSTKMGTITGAACL